ncbi:unannotated protein [freshwater metagenome]|uniref:Unannotated protein n=1 Tax=freshwater metagenome TaxID=449393 RepID=A0A6J7UZ47_9ZZZZ
MRSPTAGPWPGRGGKGLGGGEPAQAEATTATAAKTAIKAADFRIPRIML